MAAAAFLSRPKLRLAALLPLAVVPACAHHGDRAEARSTAPADWRGIATAADRARLRSWRDDWMQALAKVDAAGRRADVVAQGALLSPDAALGQPAPPPGDYRCRVVKLGARSAGMPDYVTDPGYPCRIAQEGDALSFAKLAGAQRPVGLLFPDDGARLVFLGTMMLGDERKAQQYGRDPERDMIGAMERIGPRRWRLVLPAPRWESLIDVIELVPA